MTVPPVGSTKIALGKLQLAMAALGIAAGSAVTALSVAPVPPKPANCIQVEEVYYGLSDTLLWAPLHGSPIRDSIIHSEGLTQDTPASMAPTPVQVCFPQPVPNRPVWKV